MSPNYSFDEETIKTLTTFSQQRGKKKSQVLRAGLERLTQTEHPDSVKQASIKTVIERYFAVPKHIPVFSFYSFLFLLSKKYPDEDSKEFWSEAVYLSDRPRTHAELKTQIDDEIKLMLSKQKKPNGI